MKKANTNPAVSSAAATKRKRAKIKCKKIFIYVNSTFNNTLISATKPNGDVLCQASACSTGFKGSRKSTPHAAKTAADSVAQKVKEFGAEEADIFVGGPGAGRESAIRGIREGGLIVRRLI